MRHGSWVILGRCLLLLAVAALQLPAAPVAWRAPLDLEFSFPETRWGQSLFVLGDIEELGGGRMERAIKLEPTEYPVWKLALSLPASTAFGYRFVLRDDSPGQLSDPANGKFVSELSRAKTGAGQPSSGEAWQAPVRPASPSRVVVHPGLASAALGNTRAVRVYLPAGYDDFPDRKYSVIYLQDGQNLFRPGGPFGCWEVEETLDRLIGSGAVPPLVCVGVDNTNARMSEYLPPYSSLEGSKGTADAYCKFLIEQVAPFVEARYRIAADRRRRIVGGSSLGGLLAGYIGWHHPEFASRLLCMSPSFQFGEILELFERQPARDVKFYLDSGDRGPTHDGLVNTFHARDALLKGGKFRLGENLLHRIVYGHGHNEAAWRARFGPALTALFR